MGLPNIIIIRPIVLYLISKIQARTVVPSTRIIRMKSSSNIMDYNPLTCSNPIENELAFIRSDNEF